jgi:hypothetical protein
LRVDASHNAGTYTHTMETIESLQDEYLKVASIATNLRKAGYPQSAILQLWYYQASLLGQMDELSKKV